LQAGAGAAGGAPGAGAARDAGGDGAGEAVSRLRLSKMTMSILRVICANPKCQQILRIHSWQAGKRIRCPSCKVALIAPTIPGLTAAPGMAEAAADDAVDAPSPLWMTGLFWLLVLAGFGFSGSGGVGVVVSVCAGHGPATA